MESFDEYIKNTMQAHENLAPTDADWLEAERLLEVAERRRKRRRALTVWSSAGLAGLAFLGFLLFGNEPKTFKIGEKKAKNEVFSSQAGHDSDSTFDEKGVTAASNFPKSEAQTEVVVKPFFEKDSLDRMRVFEFRDSLLAAVDRKIDAKKASKIKPRMKTGAGWAADSAEKGSSRGGKSASKQAEKEPLPTPNLVEKVVGGDANNGEKQAGKASNSLENPAEKVVGGVANNGDGLPISLENASKNQAEKPLESAQKPADGQAEKLLQTAVVGVPPTTDSAASQAKKPLHPAEQKAANPTQKPLFELAFLQRLDLRFLPVLPRKMAVLTAFSPKTEQAEAVEKQKHFQKSWAFGLETAFARSLKKEPNGFGDTLGEFVKTVRLEAFAARHFRPKWRAVAGLAAQSFWDKNSFRQGPFDGANLRFGAEQIVRKTEAKQLFFVAPSFALERQLFSKNWLAAGVSSPFFVSQWAAVTDETTSPFGEKTVENRTGWSRNADGLTAKWQPSASLAWRAEVSKSLSISLGYRFQLAEFYADEQPHFLELGLRWAIKTAEK